MLSSNFSFKLKADENTDNLVDVKLAVVGEWKGHQNGEFALDIADIEKMKINYEKRAVETVIDYEHQTLTGEIAPAAGWIKELYINEKNELWGKVSWTVKAKDYIKNGEYKYLSPVYEFAGIDEKSGVYRGATLHSASLTNKPFLDELGEVVANKNNIKEKSMDKESKQKENEELTALKAKVQSLTKENEELKNTLAEEKVNGAIVANKINKEQKEWALAYCKSDMAGFESFLKTQKVAQKNDALKNNIFENKSAKADDEDIVAMALKSIN
ncbi:Mu-like prophage I protein [Campylobacter blaseri]|uniref:Mu-like prophage I protein n=1 Tax=Campylobacter blaseri TaxID=2042961 RepID=A0A2P8QYM4_9BACT|nr:phage protease [Campylobacter blaseri]PSM51353.1 hypothetical protein CQ405_08160 [Campylobacter blaseri]PSM52803.1 hypothetical protein CRN67_08165 [Campylobacter blaseri]QKF86103.1 Mu-like prophage I protein [Campylobacter blaseri]